MLKREERQIALATLDLADVRDDLVVLRDDSTASVAERVERAIDVLDEVSARMAGQVAKRGLDVADAAEYLGVSQPTVRDWARRGALQQIPGVKPAQIDLASLRAVARALEELRERSKDGEWRRNFVDYLHDRATRDSESVKRGLEEMGRGRLEPA